MIRIFLRPVLPHGQHFLHRAHQDIGNEVEDVTNSAIDRDRIPGGTDAEPVDMAVSKAVDHVGRRQHHETNIFVGIDARGRHPEPQLVIVRGKRKRHSECQRLGAGLAPLGHDAGQRSRCRPGIETIAVELAP